jgi:hypothetical protein
MQKAVGLADIHFLNCPKAFSVSDHDVRRFGSRFQSPQLDVRGADEQSCRFVSPQANRPPLQALLIPPAPGCPRYAQTQNDEQG